ncbi:MAG TPA: hypothetical protein VJ047_13875 [Pseudomonas sp.]|nr:hypothetical protein [Pseudomonas sp.]
MPYTAHFMLENLIRPLLAELGEQRAGMAELLLRCWQLGCSSGHPDGLGPYALSSAQHRQLWDGWLAWRVELASQIRGLASQHHFLRDPDAELACNLFYSTALAWVAIIASERTIPGAGDSAGQTLLWQQVFTSEQALAA